MQRWLLALLTSLAAMFGASPVAAAAPPSIAFYYGKDIPWESLGAFDIAVVEPGNVGTEGWRHRLNPGTTVAAYIAVGEVHPTRAYFARMKPEWKLGENAAWKSIVVDQAAEGWQAFYLAEVVKPLWERGFRAFFLDTLDSFMLVAKTPEAQQRQIAGMVALVRAIKKAYPQAQLVFNRGFEILPQVHELATAVAAESLFQGWDAGRQEYREVPPADREWLWGQLLKCRDEYKLPVVAIDYVAPEKRELARETARRIRALGAVPWVANPALDMVGIGQVEVLPRKVLAIHDEPGNLAQVAAHEIHRVGTMPLNYLGLDVDYLYHGSPELAQIGERPLVGRYAGIVTWFNRDGFQQTGPLMKLISRARAEGVPVVIVGSLPEDSVMDGFGVSIGDAERSATPLVLEKLSPHVAFEIEPKVNDNAFTPTRVREGDVWLRARAPNGHSADVIAITPWGGFAADRYWKVDLPQDNGERWVVQPIEFFRAALHIRADAPVPDVTTESGRRLFFVHVDGDGFPSRAEIPGTPLAGDELYTEFLQRYRVPSTISIIEGEVSPKGIYPALAAQMEATSRKIFALPHVEMATHTWSHPFYWSDAELGLSRGERAISLAIPNYSYDVKREIEGSRDYINRLAPPGKSTRIVLWSGDCQPLAAPVAEAYRAGMLNMNGGNTWITRAEPSLTLVGPLGMAKGDYYQVYAPNQNENVYTNNWNGPFYGFERIIETFEMTEQPLRLKPVDIYYHLYLTTKRAGINSLHKVYGWAEQQMKAQALHPVFASEYIERVLDWRRATVAVTDAGFELRGGNNLREWRVPASAALPAVAPDLGIAGHVAKDTVRYVHASRPVAQFNRSGAPVEAARLESANSKLLAWEREGDLIRMRFDGHMPLQARLWAPQCELQPQAGLRATRRADGLLDIEGIQIGSTSAALRCAQ
jgi:uncharacterized protein (TIGR01370 family)